MCILPVRNAMERRHMRTEELKKPDGEWLPDEWKEAPWEGIEAVIMMNEKTVNDMRSALVLFHMPHSGYALDRGYDTRIRMACLLAERETEMLATALNGIIGRRCRNAREMAAALFGAYHMAFEDMDAIQREAAVREGFERLTERMEFAVNGIEPTGLFGFNDRCAGNRILESILAERE